MARLAALGCAGAWLMFVANAGAATTTASDADRVLAFTSFRAGAAQIFTVNADGSGLRRLTFTRGAAFEGAPAFSPDGRRIAYVCGNFELCIMNADGSSPVRLTTNDWPREFRYDRDPAWSPDGTKIAFTRSRKGRDGIWIINTDGSGLHQLPVPTGLNANPSFSPTGATIAFDHIEGRGVFTTGSNNVYVIGVDGSALRRLTDEDDGGAAPAWSPDGTRLVFSRADFDDVAQLVVMNADGSGERRLPTGTASATDPAWSPDGATIAFAGRRGGQMLLYQLPAAGGGTASVTGGSATDFDPAWQPAGAPAGGPQPTAAPSKATADARVVANLSRVAIELLASLNSDPTTGTARQTARAAKRVRDIARRIRSATRALSPSSDRGKRVRRLVLASMRAADDLARDLSGLSQGLRRHDRRAVRARRNKILGDGIAVFFPLSEAAELSGLPYAAISL